VRRENDNGNRRTFAAAELGQQIETRVRAQADVEDRQVEANLDKGKTSLKDLVDAVHDRLVLRHPNAAKEVQ